MEPVWVAEIRDQCVADRVPFFFKQWGGLRKKRAGRQLLGRTWDQMPPMPRRQAMPRVPITAPVPV